VELSNLQRQILHTTLDLSHQKVESARNKISKLNPDVEVVIYPVRLEEDNAPPSFPVMILSLTAATIFHQILLNDIAVSMGIAFLTLESSAARTNDDSRASEKCCYRCLFREPPPPEEI